MTPARSADPFLLLVQTFLGFISGCCQAETEQQAAFSSGESHDWGGGLGVAGSCWSWFTVGLVVEPVWLTAAGSCMNERDAH